MRTASRGGCTPERSMRRTLAYDARSTSMEKVDSGLSDGRRNGFSSKRPYSSVLCSTSWVSRKYDTFCIAEGWATALPTRIGGASAVTTTFSAPDFGGFWYSDFVQAARMMRARVNL